MDEPSASTIYSVSEMIDRAFGPPNKNIVDMKLMQVVIVILAKRLNVLDRWVPLTAPSSKLEHGKHKVNLSEMKIRAIKKPLLKKYLHTTITGVLKSKDQLHEITEKLSKHAVPLSEDEMRREMIEQEKMLAKIGVIKTNIGESLRSKERFKRKKDQLETIKEYHEDDSSEKGGPKTSKHEAISDKERSQAKKVITESSKRKFEEYKSLEGEDSSITPEQDEDYDNVMAILSNLQRLSEEEYSSSDLQEEKLLIGKSKEEIAEGSALVTQHQFQKLVNKVIELQKKYGPQDTPAKEIKKKMQKTASISDAIGAMQLSANMDVIESTTERLFIILREIVIQKIKKAKAAATISQEIEEEEDEEGDNGVGGMGEKDQERGRDGRSDRGQTLFVAAPLIVYTSETTTEPYVDTQQLVEPIKEEESETSTRTPTAGAVATSRENSLQAEQRMILKEAKRNITVQELEAEMWHMYDDCFIEFLSCIKHCNASTAISKERCAKHGLKLKSTLIAEESMDELEDKVKKYTSRIDDFDINCTSTTTSIQDQLSKMRQDLESALMDFFESCSKQPKRQVAITELFNQFMDLHDQCVDAKPILEELQVKQEDLSAECFEIWKELEVLKDLKATRQGLQEALVSKASLLELNGYIQKMQGFAVQGNFERQIQRAYEKFNTHEVIWQKRLDDLVKKINDKVDLEQLDTFHYMSRNIFNKIERRLNDMLKVVGDVPISNLKKKLHRKTDCVSCGAPVTKAMKDYEKENKELNILEDRAKGEQVRDKKLKNEKDSEVCFPGLPLPHARDPRARFCNKYCGSTSLRLPSLHAKRIRKETQDAVETEDLGEQKKMPCIVCNKPILPPLPGYTSQVQALCDEIYTKAINKVDDNVI